jgi:hypothetical protein
MKRLALAVPLLLWSASARAQPSLQAGGAELDEGTGELALFLAGHAADGSPAPTADPQLYLDGSKEGLSPEGRDKVLDYAADRPKWTPPFAIGVVYQWSKGAPQTIMDGLEALFRHVPAKVPVYPTPYGQGHRQVVTKLTAARVAGGDLADYPQIPGDQHKLVPAVQFNASKLAEDRAPIKLLFIITDGRGQASGKEFGPFAALGEDLRRQGIQVAIVSLPSPVDATDAAQNVSDLSEAAHARLIKVDRLADLPTSIELLGETVSSVERVHFTLPWLTRQLGGEHRVTLKAAVAGASVRAPALTILLPRQAGMLVALIVAVLLAVGGVLVAFRVMRAGPRAGRPVRTPTGRTPAMPASTPAPSRSSPPEPVESDPATAAVTEVIRVGASPTRAVLSLSRALGAGALEVGGRGRAEGLLGTRAGQARLREVRRLLGGSPQDVFVREIGPILGGAMREQVPPREGARRLRARLPLESWTSLLRLSDADLDTALASTPELAGQAGRGYVRSVAEDLQRPPSGATIALWLVRVAGPGQPGETFVISGSSVLGGRGGDVALSDDRMADNHAQLTIDGNDATITPLDGKVEIDGEEAGEAAPLYDGHTLSLGRSLYVVRIVRRDVVLAERSRGPARAGRAGSVPRSGARRR